MQVEADHTAGDTQVRLAGEHPDTEEDPDLDREDHHAEQEYRQVQVRTETEEQV